ncbi:MAG: DUF1580 domain-containing protein [Planctomycetes bacterium]|nr:DUF1580 domain-containing protein [Planctomycetota bacterium]
MAIDLKNETHVSIREAPKHIPGRPNISTVYRWMLRQQNALESFRVGGRTFTTIEAIARFIEGCNSSGALVTLRLIRNSSIRGAVITTSRPRRHRSTPAIQISWRKPMRWTLMVTPGCCVLR